MTKTKSQLRAEAVERLREYVEENTYDGGKSTTVTAAGIGNALVGWPITADKFIDLLTDDEQAEGDVVAILRKASTCTSRNTSVGDVLRYNVPRSGNPSAWECAEDACGALADMIERDYVRKNEDCGPCYTCSRLAELVNEVGALRAVVGDIKVPEDPGEASIASVDAFVRKQTHHEAADTREKPYIVVDGERKWVEADSREKLEADVRGMVAYRTSTLMFPPSANKITEMLPSISVDTVLGWLDRQAAIDRKEFQTILEEIHKCVRNGSR